MGLLRGRDFDRIEATAVKTKIYIGSIIPFAGINPPNGWLLCGGQILDILTYFKLYQSIGVTYGGDDISTFGIPDLRGRCGIGKDNMGGTSANRITAALSGISGNILGASGGSQTHTLTLAQLSLHGHPTRYCDDTEGNGDGGLMVGNEIRVENFPSFTGTLANTQGRQITGAGGSGTHQNTQPSIILNFIIKYE